MKSMMMHTLLELFHDRLQGEFCYSHIFYIVTPWANTLPPPVDSERLTTSKRNQSFSPRTHFAFYIARAGNVVVVN